MSYDKEITISDLIALLVSILAGLSAFLMIPQVCVEIGYFFDRDNLLSLNPYFQVRPVMLTGYFLSLLCLNTVLAFCMIFWRRSKCTIRSGLGALLLMCILESGALAGHYWIIHINPKYLFDIHPYNHIIFIPYAGLACVATMYILFLGKQKRGGRKRYRVVVFSITVISFISTFIIGYVPIGYFALNANHNPLDDLVRVVLTIDRGLLIACLSLFLMNIEAIHDKNSIGNRSVRSLMQVLKCWKEETLDESAGS